MSFIKNMGIYWKKDHVWWGTKGKGNQGHLCGSAVLDGTKLLTEADEEETSTNRERIQVDFAKQRGIYVLYRGYQPIYIGQAGGRNDQTLHGRLKQHLTDHLADRWDSFSWFGVLGVDTKEKKLAAFEDVTIKNPTDLLNHVEGILIEVSEGLLNKQGAKWDGGVKFSQIRDERLGKTTEQMIEDLWNRFHTQS